MYTFIYPETVDYFHCYQRPQQLLNGFGKLGYNSIFLNPQNKYRRNHFVEKLENVWLINKSINENKKYENKKYEKINEIAKGTKKVLWITYPKQYKLVEKFNPDIVVYDIIDDAVEEFTHWASYVYKMIGKADIVTCSANELYNKFKNLHPNVYLIKNAADFEHFYNVNFKEIRTLKRINKPIIGYYGVLASWLDYELIKYMADKFPNYSFVYIGEYFVKRFRLPKRKNIYYLGHISYSELPFYSNYFDVCIIPFKKTDMIKSCNPIKLWEYLSMGKPVVATNIEELKEI
ncbi:MAG: glycosyltransferase, partial [bacterium]